MRTLLPLAAVLTLSLLQGASAASQEDKLVGVLLDRLKPTGSIARPVADAKDNVTVSLGLSLVRIARVKHYTAELQVWVKMAWRDPRLKWDATEYDGLSSVALPADLMWLPDIRPYTPTGYQPDKEVASRVVLNSKGDAIYVLPVQLQVNECETHKNRSVTCPFLLGSWVYNGHELDIKLETGSTIDLDNLVKSDWKVFNAEVKRIVKVYPCCPEPYVSAAYKLTLIPDVKKSSKSKKRN